MARIGSAPTEPLDLAVTVFDSDAGIDPRTGRPPVRGVAITMHPDASVPEETRNRGTMGLNPKGPGKLDLRMMQSHTVESIRQTAGSNSYPYLDKTGKQIGTTYGVKASLMDLTRGKTIQSPYTLDPRKAIEPTQFSVGLDAEGRDINSRSLGAQKEIWGEVRAARKAAYDKEISQTHSRFAEQGQPQGSAQMGG